MGQHLTPSSYTLSSTRFHSFCRYRFHVEQTGSSVSSRAWRRSAGGVALFELKTACSSTERLLTIFGFDVYFSKLFVSLVRSASDCVSGLAYVFLLRHRASSARSFRNNVLPPPVARVCRDMHVVQYQGIMYAEMPYRVWKHVSLALPSLLPMGLEYTGNVRVVDAPRENAGARLYSYTCN